MEALAAFDAVGGLDDWEVQNTFLEDVDRIEVVRGLGGTLWVASPVNGVVQADVYSGRGVVRPTFATITARYGKTLEQDSNHPGGSLRTRWNRALRRARDHGAGLLRQDEPPRAELQRGFDTFKDRFATPEGRADR